MNNEIKRPSLQGFRSDAVSTLGVLGRPCL